MSEDSTVILSCHQISMTFADGKVPIRVLANINLDVKKGEQIAIVGASGTGKSTLLHLLGGLSLPSSGTVQMLGRTINPLSETQRGQLRNQYLGFIYQFHHLLPEFTALENVAMPLLIRRVSPLDAQSQARSLLEEVGLGHRLHHKPAELSGGERQRAAVARALVTSPQCILADEPTGNLDQKTAVQLYERMRAINLARHASLVMVTHDLKLADRADRILRLIDGELLEEC